MLWRGSTRVSYGHLLSLAERPDTLGSIPVDVIRPALVQAFLDGLADRPAQQKCAQTALRAVEKWALVRDLLPFPITVGTQAPGGTGGHVPWTEEQVALAEKRHLAKYDEPGATSLDQQAEAIRNATRAAAGR
jgi:hypothetical protein